MAKFTITPPQGGPVTVEAPSQEAALDQVLNASGGPDVSGLGSFSRGAVGMIPLGNQAYAGVAGLAEHKPYAQERQELEQEIAADKETNPGARLSGQVAGVVAPIALTGGLGAPESLLGAAGQGAAVGGLYGAGNAIDTLAGGGTGTKAAEDVALGAGIGAAGGAAGKLAGDFISGLGRKAVVGAAKAGDEAEPLAVKTATDAASTAAYAQPKGLGTAAGASAEAPAAVQAKQGFFPSKEELRAEILAGNLGGSPRQLRAMPGKDLIGSLNHMGDIIKANSTPENPLIGMTDRYADRLNKFVALQNKAGKVIGDTIEQAGVPPIPTDGIASGLINNAKFLNPSDQAQLQSVVDQLEKYAKLDGTPGAISFKRLQQLKGDLGDVAFKGQGSPVLQGAYHVVSDLQDNELEKLGAAINKPAFQSAKEAYQMTSRAIPMLRMATARSLAKGYSSFGAPLAALVTGHPVAALGALMKEPLQRAAGAAAFSAPEIGETLGAVPAAVGAQAAKAAPEAAAVTDIHLQHPAMAPWREIFTKNAAQAKDAGEIAKANAVTDFTLSQRDPAYAAAKQKAADSPEMGQAPKKMAEGGLVTPTGFPEPQESDNPPAGAEIPAEQKLVNAVNSVGAGYGAGQLGSSLAQKGYTMAKNLGEAGAIFPKGPLYHGTSADFTTPQPNANGIFWTTPDKAAAESYANTYYRTGNPRVLSYEHPDAITDLADLSDPVSRQFKDAVSAARQGTMGAGISDAQWPSYADFGVVERYTPWLKNLGAKAIKVADTTNGGKAHTAIAILDPSLLKPMAAGGLVQSAEDAITNAGPVEGFGSTLQGFANLVKGARPPAPVAAPQRAQLHQPFNPQMEEQLKAFLMKAKGDDR